MTSDEKEGIGLMKYSVIVPLINGSWDSEKSNKAFFRDAATKTYTLPNGKTRKFSAPTIERWYNDYRKSGFQALIPHSRADEGRFRALDDDLKARIQYIHEQHPRLPAAEIRRQLLEDGLIPEDGVSESTINRFLARIKAEQEDFPEKERRRVVSQGKPGNSGNQDVYGKIEIPKTAKQIPHFGKNKFPISAKWKSELFSQFRIIHF